MTGKYKNSTHLLAASWLQKQGEEGGLTGHPHRFQSRCQAAPSPPLLSASLEVAHQWRLEAGTVVDLSQPEEAPL